MAARLGGFRGGRSTVVACLLPVLNRTGSPGPECTMSLHGYLLDNDNQYDSTVTMVGLTFHAPGYRQRLLPASALGPRARDNG